MIKFLRRTFRRTKRRPKRYDNVSNTDPYYIPAPVSTKKWIRAYVMLLTEEKVTIDIPKKAVGSYLMEKIHKFVDLPAEESNFFGLQFTDHNNVRHWLNPAKQIRKQATVGQANSKTLYTLHFRVKFYPTEPTSLKDEIGKYQFFLQLKQDLRSSTRLGTANLPFSIAVEMAGFALQSELGDYLPNVVTEYTVSEFRFLPDDQQTEEFELAAFEHYKTCKGLTPALAELEFLNKAKWLEMYGVDLHEVISNKDKNPYKFGLTPTGILIYDRGTKIGLFYWKKIKRLDMKNKKIYLEVGQEDINAPDGELIHKFVFETHCPKATKHLWKSAIEHHQFFNLPSRAARNRDELIRRSSRFKFTGQTQSQIANSNAFQRRGTVTTFSRRSSKRYKGRSKFATFSAPSHMSREIKPKEIEIIENYGNQLKNPNINRNNNTRNQNSNSTSNSRIGASNPNISNNLNSNSKTSLTIGQNDRVANNSYRSQVYTGNFNNNQNGHISNHRLGNGLHHGNKLHSSSNIVSCSGSDNGNDRKNLGSNVRPPQRNINTNQNTPDIRNPSRASMREALEIVI